MAVREGDHLRAHVAALVMAMRHVQTAAPDEVAPYAFLLDSPDLAALVEREQRRDAVIAAARVLDKTIWSGPLHPPSAEGLHTALRALDAEKTRGE